MAAVAAASLLLLHTRHFPNTIMYTKEYSMPSTSCVPPAMVALAVRLMDQGVSPLGPDRKGDIKKRIFYCRADRKRLPPPPYGQLFVKKLLVCFLSEIMILCVLKWILQKSHFHPTTRIPNSSLLPCYKTVR